MKGLLSGLLLGCATLLASASLRAEEASLVRVVSAPRAGAQVDEARTRLSAELRAAGFSVRVVEGEEGASGPALVEGDTVDPIGKAGVDEPVAAIAILATDLGPVADVWVIDRVTHETLVRRVEVGDPQAPNAASDLAVRSVELLRASLLEVSVRRKQAPPAKAAARPEPQPSAPPTSARTSRPERTAVDRTEAERIARHAKYAGSVELGVGVLAGGGFGVASGLLLRIGYDLPAAFSLRALVVPPLASTEPAALRTSSGSVMLRQTLAAVDLAYAIRFDRGRVEALLSIGAGVYDLRVVGNATLPHRGEVHDVVAAALVGGVGMGVGLVPGLTLRSQLQFIGVTPEPAITILGVEAAHAGRPAFLPSIGLVSRF